MEKTTFTFVTDLVLPSTTEFPRAAVQEVVRLTSEKLSSLRLRVWAEANVVAVINILKPKDSIILFSLCPKKHKVGGHFLITEY